MNCKICGKKANSEYCFKHKPKKPLSSGKGLKGKMGKGILYQVREKGKITDFDFLNKEKLKEFFIKCWKNKPHYSEISGKFLGNTCSSIYQHHILPKSKYTEACFDEENIIFLTPEEHASVELDMYKYEEINKRREQLLKKYERS